MVKSGKMCAATMLALGLIPCGGIERAREKVLAEQRALAMSSQFRVFGDLDQVRSKLFTHGLNFSQEVQLSTIETREGVLEGDNTTSSVWG